MARGRRTRYTVEPGRQIYLDGEPFISIGREGDTIPTDADRITHVVAAMLNRARYLPEYTMERRERKRRGEYGGY